MIKHDLPKRSRCNPCWELVTLVENAAGSFSSVEAIAHSNPCGYIKPRLNLCWLSGCSSCPLWSVLSDEFIPPSRVHNGLGGGNTHRRLELSSSDQLPLVTFG